MKKVLVTGATGAVGLALVRLLISSGYKVKILVRGQHKLDGLFPEVESVYGDINDSACATEAVSGVDAVFHLAALLHDNNPKKEMEQEYHRVNVEGTSNLLIASCNNCVKRFIFFSTISVYGENHGDSWFNEEDKVYPATAYAKTKYRAEILLKEFSKENRKPGITILRLAAVYGNRVKGNYRTMIRAISKGFFIYPGKGLNYRTLVHEEDVARAALMTFENPDAVGKTYNVTDGTVHTVKDIVNSISSALHRKVFKIYFPNFLFQFIVNMGENSFLLKFSSFKTMIGLIAKMNGSIHVSGQKIINELCFKPKWDLDSGMINTINGFSGNYNKDN